MRLDLGTTHAEEIKLGFTSFQCTHGHGVIKVTLGATFDPNLPSTSVKGTELIA